LQCRVAVCPDCPFDSIGHSAVSIPPMERDLAS
jgi:hypothetical protein